jgi:hypothetical protein
MIVNGHLLFVVLPFVPTRALNYSGTPYNFLLSNTDIVINVENIKFLFLVQKHFTLQETITVELNNRVDQFQFHPLVEAIV